MTPVEIPAEKWSGSVREVTLGSSYGGGTRGSTVTVGGETALPFLGFEGKMPNKPALAVEVQDMRPDDWSAELMSAWGDVMDDAGAWAAKAVDAVYHVELPPAAKKLRELFYSCYYFYDHTLHFYYLGGPDFVVGPTAPPEKRNILGLSAANPDVARRGVRLRQFGQEVIETLAGRRIHAQWVVPGGVDEPLTEAGRCRIRKWLPEARETIELRAGVTRVNPSSAKGAPPGMGLRFTHVTHRDEDSLTRFLTHKRAL